MAMTAPHIKVRSQNSFHLDISREIASLEGHLFALPILFINLGGEMIYVIEHRLKAQNLEDRLNKVMQDVIGTIFRPRIIDELFKPQHLLSEASMRSLFQKLAHASIMSLNQESMDKLLDLMSMTVKYQTFACRYPAEIIFCTLNHLDYMRDLVKHVDPVMNSLRKVYSHIDRTYCRMDAQNMVLLRNTLLRYFQDRKTRLSVFLNAGIQRENDGVMKIPRDHEISSVSLINQPGKMIFYKTTKGVISKETLEFKTESFAPGGHFTFGPKVLQTTTFDTGTGNRGTDLGINVFASYKGINVASSVVKNSQENLPLEANKNIDEPVEHRLVLNPSGAAEIEVLARILGALPEARKNDSTAFEMDFMTDEDNRDYVTGKLPPTVRPRAREVVRVQLSKTAQQEIDIGLDELISAQNTSDIDEMDLLALMDNATESKKVP